MGRLSLISLLFLVLSGCAVREATFHPNDISLYSRLGGKAGIGLIVTEATNTLLKDELFENTLAEIRSDPEVRTAFEGRVVALLCARTGGECVYDGPALASLPDTYGFDVARFVKARDAMSGALTRFRMGEARAEEFLVTLDGVRAELFPAAQG